MLEERKEVEADAMLHPNNFLMVTTLPNANILLFICLIAASLLMHQRQENVLTVRESNPEEVCYPPVETMLLHKLLCNTTARQSVCCAGLRWMQVTSVPTQPAALLIGLVSPLLSFPLFVFELFLTFLVFPSLSAVSRPVSCLMKNSCTLGADWCSGSSCVWILCRGA